MRNAITIDIIIRIDTTGILPTSGKIHMVNCVRVLVNYNSKFIPQPPIQASYIPEKNLSLTSVGKEVNYRGTPEWANGQVLRQMGPVTYLVRSGSQVHRCHEEHMIKEALPPGYNIGKTTWYT